MYRASSRAQPLSAYVNESWTAYLIQFAPDTSEVPFDFHCVCCVLMCTCILWICKPHAVSVFEYTCVKKQ